MTALLKCCLSDKTKCFLSDSDCCFFFIFKCCRYGLNSYGFYDHKLFENSHIFKVYRRSERKAPSAADITDLFKRWYGADDLKDAMSPNTDFDDLREVTFFPWFSLEVVN